MVLISKSGIPAPPSIYILAVVGVASAESRQTALPVALVLRTAAVCAAEAVPTVVPVPAAVVLAVAAHIAAVVVEHVEDFPDNINRQKRYEDNQIYSSSIPTHDVSGFVCTVR